MKTFQAMMRAKVRMYKKRLQIHKGHMVVQEPPLNVLRIPMTLNLRVLHEPDGIDHLWGPIRDNSPGIWNPRVPGSIG